MERAEGTLGESQDSGTAIKDKTKIVIANSFNFMCLEDIFVLLSY